MGSAIFGPTKRYMGGKSLLKFFSEDVVPVMSHIFERLKINHADGFELFRHFAAIDAVENGVIDLQQCLEYFTLEKTPFSERIFYHVLTDDEDTMVQLMHKNGKSSEDARVTGINTNVNRLKKIGLTFEDFVLLVWSYCTLDRDGIARYVFEIFDTDNKLSLHKSFLKTIFQMLYNTNDVEEDYFSFYPITLVEEKAPMTITTGRSSKRTRITKKTSPIRPAIRNRIKASEILRQPSEDLNDVNDSDDEDEVVEKVFREEISKISFMETSKTKVLLIQPALSIQSHLRKKIGGVSRWLTLANFRRKELAIYDNQCDTLVESLAAILESAHDIKQHRLDSTTEKILEAKSQKLKSEKNAAQKELQLLQKQQHQEKLTNDIYGRDRPMKIAWSIYEERKDAFEREEFTMEDPYYRRQRREELYYLLDQAVDVSRTYHEEHDDELFEQMTGTDEDHEARLQDYMKLPEGSNYYTLLFLFSLFRAMEDEILEKNSRNKYYDETKKSDKQQQTEANLMELSKLFQQYTTGFRMFDNKTERDLIMRQLSKRSFVDDIKVGKKLAKKSELTEAEKKAHDIIFNDLKDKTIFDAKETILKQQEERRRDYIRKEFSLASNLGSRITRFVTISIFASPPFKI
jgi:hypothetical protein